MRDVITENVFLINLLFVTTNRRPLIRKSVYYCNETKFVFHNATVNRRFSIFNSRLQNCLFEFYEGGFLIVIMFLKQ